MCGSVRYRDGFCITIKHRTTHRLLRSNSSSRKEFLSSPNHRTVRVSIRVTFGYSLPWKWASRESVSQPKRTSNRMRRPNSGKFQRKPSAVACNNGSIDGTSVCVCVCVWARARARVLLWRWLGKRCHMSHHYSAIPQFRELFDCPLVLNYIPEDNYAIIRTEVCPRGFSCP